MNTNDSSACDRAELVRDYAFDELSAPERLSVEQHLSQCSDCAAELDRLQLTTAALRILPEQEVPRRIAFVSDHVPERGWFAGLWNSASRLGFASACVIAAGLSFSAFANLHRAPEVPTVVQTAAAPQQQKIDEAAVNKAVALAVNIAVEKAHADDVRITQAALAEIDNKYATQQRNLMIAMQTNLDEVRKRSQTMARLRYSDPPTGVGR